MSRTMFIPKGMYDIDALASQTPRWRRDVELGELNRLHDLAVPHLDPAVLRAIPKNHGEWRRRVLSGEIRLPISGDNLHLTSPLWGSMNLADLSNPESYHSNVGYIRFCRDIGAIMSCKNVPGYPRLLKELPEHFGGSSRFVADWRKSLYLLQLAESERYVQQLVGLNGLDVFAKRYFKGDVSRARSFAINIFSKPIFDTLNWKTARIARAQIPYQNRRQLKAEIDYERILSWARDLHGDKKSLPLEAFVQRLQRLDDSHQRRPMSARRGSYFRRFGRIRLSLIEAGIDTTELDDIFSQHGLGYREVPALYEELVGLARDEHLSTEQLSRIAIERRMVAGAVCIAFSRAGYKILLDAFHDYGVETDELETLLIKNAPAYIASRIRAWHDLPQSRKDLFAYLGLTSLQSGGFVTWVGKHIGEPYYRIAAAAFRKQYESEMSAAHRKAAVRRESTRRPRVVIQEGSSPEPLKPEAFSAVKSPLDVFADLIVDNDPPLDVSEKLEDAMEPLERIKGPVPPAQLKRLKSIFSRELGADVVDAALRNAGIEID